MSTNDSATQEGFANDDDSNELEQRSVRALTECMTVLPEGGGVFEVVTQSGSSYAVDSREGRCTCPDHQYRDVTCKHARRVAFATGERHIPAWVDTGAIDPLLGDHVESDPVKAATDGGATVDTDDNGDEGDDCQCDGLSDDGPVCWPCYSRGNGRKTDTSACEGE